MDKKIVGIASIQERQVSLALTVHSLYDQVDVICVYLNDYKRIPKFLKKEKIEVYQGEDLTDLGKFFGLNYHSGYYFSCDDDLIYPKGYIDYMIKKINQYDCIISCHGRIFNDPLKSYYRSARSYHCLLQVKQDIKVNCGGTGVMGFKTDIGFNLSEIPKPYACMADVHVGVWANGKVPIMVAAHPKGWIRLSKWVDLDKTIFNKHIDNDGLQTELCQINWE